MQKSVLMLAGVAIAAAAVGAAGGVVWQSRVDQKKAELVKLYDFPRVVLSCEKSRDNGRIFIMANTLDQPYRFSDARVMPTSKGDLTVRCVPNPGDADPEAEPHPKPLPSIFAQHHRIAD